MALYHMSLYNNFGRIRTVGNNPLSILPSWNYLFDALLHILFGSPQRTLMEMNSAIDVFISQVRIPLMSLESDDISICIEQSRVSYTVDNSRAAAPISTAYIYL